MHNKIILRNFWKNNDTTKIFLKNLFSELEINNQIIMLSSVFLKKSLVSRLIYNLMNKFDFLGNRTSYSLIKYNLAFPVKESNTKNIWYTGENIRPPYDKNWDLLLSFEDDEFIENNIFLPFWATTLGETTAKAELNQLEYVLPRNLIHKEKKFACAVISNPEPFRMRIINEISKISKVDVFGSVSGNIITDKNQMLSEYHFNICFENDLYPNYITEKIFQSWKSGAVPIWWGLDKSEYINEKALINFASGDISENLEKIKFLILNPTEITYMANLPILNKKYDFSLLTSKINNILR